VFQVWSSGIHCQKSWDNILLNHSDTPDFQTDAKSLFWNLTYCLVVKSWSGTRDLSFFYQKIFLELDFLSRMFCFRRIFNTESMFPSLLLHILDSDRAKWFMICKICIAFQRSLQRILFLSLKLHQFADNQHEKYVISYRFVLVCKFWFFCFFLRFSSFWDVVAEKSQQTVSNWTQHNSFAFFMLTFSHLSKSFLFHFFFLFWDVVANAVGVAGSLFISSGPFCTFQSEPRIY